MSQKIINVCIGEVKIAKKGEILKAILGSCVGIAFIWKKNKICGLAHCLLANSPKKSYKINGRFVDQAIPSLIALMKIKLEDFDDIEIIVAGGGNMTRPNEKNRNILVGFQNFSAVLAECKKRGLKPNQLYKGENEGRKIIIDSLSCSYSIENIPRLLQAG